MTVDMWDLAETSEAIAEQAPNVAGLVREEWGVVRGRHLPTAIGPNPSIRLGCIVRRIRASYPARTD